MPLNKNYLKIIQITDTHLFGSGGDLFGVDTNNNFNQVIKKIAEDECSDLDAIFLTGDMSQDHTKESYILLAERISPLNVPVYWIAGNHDSVETMGSVLDKYSNFTQLNNLKIHNWGFMPVDTCISGRDEGLISDATLAGLRQRTLDLGTSKLAVIMHHQPMDVGTPLVDQYGLVNKNAFVTAIADLNIDLIICGHVHNDYTLKVNNTDVQAGPATCLQWRKKASGHDLDLKVGYKVYHFHNEGYECHAKMWCA